VTSIAHPAPPISLAPARSATEIVDFAFNLVRRHYPVFLTVSAVAMSPLLLVAPFSQGAMKLVVLVMGVIFTGWGEASLLLGVAAAYRGEPVPGAEAQLKAGLGIAWPVIRITLARNIISTLGMILFIVPGLLALAYYALGAPVAALEKLPVREAIKRGGALARGEYGRIIAALLLCAAIYLLMIFGVGMLVALLSTSEIISYLATTVVEIALLPIPVAITVLLYYDIRERREGLDIEMALARGGAPSAGPPAPTM
jgi:hypothetical protein